MNTELNITHYYLSLNIYTKIPEKSSAKTIRATAIPIATCISNKALELISSRYTTPNSKVKRIMTRIIHIK